MSTLTYSRHSNPFASQSESHSIPSWLYKVLLFIAAFALVFWLFIPIARAGESAGTNSTVKTELKFSGQQITQYELLLGQLVERAEIENDPAQVARLKEVLAKLQNKIDLTKESRDTLNGSRKRTMVAMNREDLKNNLIALQESGKEAVGIFVDADNRIRGYGPRYRTLKVSATN